MKNPEFHDLIQRDKRTWPRCLLWHGWLLALDSNGGWAVGVGEPPASILESRLGVSVPHHLGDWFGSEEFVSGTGSGHLAANPDVWTDGSLVRDDVACVCCGGAGIFAATSGACWVRRSWVHLDLLPPGDDPESERCRLYVSVPKPVQSVQRAELWGLF